MYGIGTYYSKFCNFYIEFVSHSRNDTARVKMWRIEDEAKDLTVLNDVADIHVAAGGNMQIKKKESTPERDIRVLTARLTPNENGGSIIYVSASWKKADMTEFENSGISIIKADKEDDLQQANTIEG